MPLGNINVQQISLIYKVLDLKINSHFVIKWQTVARCFLQGFLAILTCACYSLQAWQCSWIGQFKQLYEKKTQSKIDNNRVTAIESKQG
jgi:hypothetical protein